MSWPALVPPALCTTPIRLTVLGEGLTEDGAPETLFQGDLACLWQDGGRVMTTDRERLVVLAGRAWFPGDVCPEVPVISAGWGEIRGQRRRILSGRKARDPDGNVNYTEVRFV